MQFVLRDGKIVLVICIVKQLWNNEALACDSNGKLGLVGKTGLLKNLGNVPFNGSDCDVQLLRDLIVFQSLADQP